MDARDRIDRLARMIPAGSGDGPTVTDVFWDDPQALGWVAELMDPTTPPERAREAALRIHARSSPTPALLAHLGARYPATTPIQ